MRRLIKSVAMLVIIALIGVVIAEVAVRVIFPAYTPIFRLYKYVESERGKFARYDSLLGWTGKEGAEDDFEWVDTRTHVRQNRYGFRDAGYDFKRGERRRALVLGDSFVWGFGVENQDIFTSRIVSMSDSTLEVVNLGVSGYATDQEYLLWRELGRKWSPEEVFLFITPSNDLFDMLSSMAYGYNKPIFVLDSSGSPQLKNVPIPFRKVWADETEESNMNRAGSFQRILSHSIIANMVVVAVLKNTKIRKYFYSRGTIPNRPIANKKDYFIYMKKPLYEAKMGWELFFKLVALLDESVSKNGGQLKVVVVPTIVQVYPDLWENYVRHPETPKGFEYDPDATFDIVRKGCEELDIEVVDIVTGLREAGRKNPYLYFPFNRHWTSDGHKVVAEILWEALNKAP